MVEAVDDTPLGFNIYFDMVSAIDTTGAPVFEATRLAGHGSPVAGTVAWVGGLLIWITALAVLQARSTSAGSRPGVDVIRRKPPRADD